jgi:hypothetical protein
MPAIEYKAAYEAGLALRDEVASAEAFAWLSTTDRDIEQVCAHRRGAVRAV